MIYRDHDLDTAAKTGFIAPDLRQRLVRAKINNMMAMAYSPPFNRKPTNQELNEMAKSLILTYPCLKDNETGHGLLFKQLQKRLYNEKAKTKKKIKVEPVNNEVCVNKNGDLKQVEDLSPAKKPRLTEPEPKLTSGISQQNENDLGDDLVEELGFTDTGSDADCEYPIETMTRHYNSLIKETQKTKPNIRIINTYLNKEFQGRRNWLRTTTAQQRCLEFYNKYPCFKDHVEIVEEVRRVLKQPENKNPMEFLEACIQRLCSKIDFLIYYGVSKSLQHPLSPSLHAKILHVLKNICLIFPGKKKKIEEVVYNMKDYEDPQKWLEQRKSETPVLLLANNMVYLVVGRQIISTFDSKKIPEAVISYLSLYYLLDFDYPPSLELGFSILQFICFEDKATPVDLNKSFNAALADFHKFEKACSE